MFSTLKYENPPPLCKYCDGVPLRILARLEGDIRLHFPVQGWCSNCTKFDGVPPRDWDLTHQFRTEEATVDLPSDVFAACSSNAAICSDKNTLASLVNRSRGLGSDEGLAAAVRVLPVAFEAIHEHQALHRLPGSNGNRCARWFVQKGRNLLGYICCWRFTPTRHGVCFWEPIASTLDPADFLLRGADPSSAALLGVPEDFDPHRPCRIDLLRTEGVPADRTTRTQSLGASARDNGLGTSPAIDRTVAPVLLPSASTRGLSSFDALVDTPTGTVLVTHEQETLPAGVDRERAKECQTRFEPCDTTDWYGKPRVAHRRAPSIVKSSHFEQCVDNVKAAVKGRIEGKTREFNPGHDLMQRINKTVQAIADKVLSKKAILAWLDQPANQAFIGLSSKKWSVQQFEGAVAALRAKGLNVDAIKVEWEALVKDEVLPTRGKAPRLIQACGPQGQILALMHVCCFEELLSRWFDKHNIKHKNKKEALAMISEELKSGIHHLYEGDGTAWDTTISPQLRAATENVLLNKVQNVLWERMDPLEVPSAWAEADMKDRGRNTRRLKSTKSKQFAIFTLANFRASGDRGTSILNWVINMIIWTSILLKNPETCVCHPEYTWFEPSTPQTTSGKILYKFWFEGDDSLVMTSSDLSPLDIVKMWTSAGFNLKLISRRSGDPVVFVGNCTRRINDGLAPFWLPEPNRNIAGASYQNNDQDPMSHAYSCAFRADGFRLYPPLNAYFLAIAETWRTGGKVEIDAPTQYAWFGSFEPGRTVDDDIFTRTDQFDQIDEARAILGAYAGAEFTPAQEDGLLGLTSIGMDDDWVERLFPIEYLK